MEQARLTAGLVRLFIDWWDSGRSDSRLIAS